MILPFYTTINWEKEKETLQHLANSGLSYQQIGDKYNVTRERIRQIFKRYGLAHAQSIKRTQRQIRRYKKYGDTSQELYKEKRRRFYNKKANAKRTGIPFTISFGEIEWPMVCPVFGTPIDYLASGISENSPSLDQIVPGKGYVPGNVAVMSWRANRIKNDGTLEEHVKVVTWLEKVLHGK